MIGRLVIPVLLLAATGGAVALAGQALVPPRIDVAPSRSAAAEVKPRTPRPPVKVELPAGDPFRPFDQRAPAAGRASGGSAGVAVAEALRFYGTIEKGSRRLALINDRYFGVGDKVDGAVVKEIDARRVVLDRGGAVEVLTSEER